VRQVPTGFFSVLSYFTRHKTAANLLLVVMMVAGLAATTQIRSQFFPDVVISNVTVIVTWEGAGPEDLDQAVVSLLEPALLNVEGVEETRSTATEGRAQLTLDFEEGWDMARAADDVKAAVDGVTDLPEGIDEPRIRRGAWRDRVTDLIISGNVEPEQLARFADEFTARAFRAGVTRTTIRGVGAPEVLVEAPELSLIRHGVTLSELSAAISEEATADPAGEVSGAAVRVRTGIEKRTAEDVQSIVVRSSSDGNKLTVGDVAQVSTLGSSRQRAYYVAEKPAVSIRVDRADLGDAIDMQKTVQKIADEMQKTLPEGVKIELIRTRAQAISDRLNILMENGLLGLALVIGLLFLFLNARTAFWVAAGIPVAMLATIALMYAVGLTINMVSLFGLIICLGIVVDDAIVVGEHADFRARRLMENPVLAAENAAIRMAPPVFSATITTVIAFFALVAIGGRFGSLIKDIPFTVIVVLLASLIECFLILPNHMSHALQSIARRRWYDFPSHFFNIGFSWFREKIFKKFIYWILILRYPVIAFTIFLLAFQASLFLKGDVIFRFFNAPERGSISGNIAMLSGADRDDTREMVRELQRAVDATAKRFEVRHGINPVTFALGEVGGTTGRGLAGSDTKDKDLLGSIAVELIDADLRPYTSFAFIGELKEEVRKHPLLETLSFRGWRSGPGGDSLSVKFYGANSAVLKQASEKLKEAVSGFTEVSAVEDDLAYDKEEFVLELTPQGQALGFTIDGIGRELRGRLNGIVAASFPVGTRTGEIRVTLPEEELTGGFLETTRLRTSLGTYVPLTDVVTTSSQIGFAAIRRENGLKRVSVSGDISEDDPVRASQIVEELRTTILPGIAADLGVEFLMGGLAEQESEFLSDAKTGFILCLLGIYLTLTWVFSSWSRPMVVMAIIPFGFVGTIYGHYMWEVPLSMFSIIGLIGMSGIIINDSIVLVSTVDEYSKDKGLVTAIVEAASDRFRPVLLTTLTTVLGLLPLLYETSRQAQFLKPTVITLCYGLGFGLLLVLLVVPSLLVVQQDFKKLFASARRILFARRLDRTQRLFFCSITLCYGLIIGGTMGYLTIMGTRAPWLSSLPDQFSPFLGSFLAMVIGIVAVSLLSALVIVAVHLIEQFFPKKPLVTL
jgi:multidrug efflux pump subunit AcrB